MGIKTISISVDDGIPRKIELSMGGDWDGFDEPACRVTRGGMSFTQEFPVASEEEMLDAWFKMNDMDTDELAGIVDTMVDQFKSILDDTLTRAI